MRRRIVRDGDVATQAVALIPRGGMAVAYEAVDRRPDSGMWRIGRYTVRELRLPPDFFHAGNRELVLGTSLLTLSTRSPYVIQRRSLVSGQVGRTEIGACETHPYWGYNDSMPWEEAILVCAQEKAPSVLYLIGNGGISISAFELPPQPPLAEEYQVWALGFAAGGFQRLFWEVAYNEGGLQTPGTGPPPSGILNLQTGRNEPIPAALAAAALYVSPDAALFAVRGDELYRWTGAALTLLGTLPDLRVQAVEDDGAVWADVIPNPGPAAPTSDEFVREVPGGAARIACTVQGSVLGYGAGYIIWLPNAQLVGPTIRITFPLQHRSLSFNDIAGQPLVDGPDGGALSQVVVPTLSGAAVIEVSP